MQEKTFQAYLEKRGFEGGEVESQVRFIAQLEQRLREDVPSWTFEDLNQASVQAVVDRLIDNGENTIPNLQALARYAYVINNDSMYLAIFQLLDGYEAMDQLYAKLGNYVGEDLRDMTFEGMPLPPLGVSNCEKARFAYRIMRRMTQVFEESTCREILKDSLRLLPEADYQEAKRAYIEICNRDIDAYLDWKGSRFIETLESHRERQVLWFGQEITGDVIAFVRVNPQIGRGVREGNTIVETKIPYNTKAFLEETDPDKKRYHYCHCPWAKESLRKNAYKVSPIFCQCSAGFHKRPYEIIFDQPIRAEVLKSVLNGDDSCQFAIHLPVSVVT
jgi:hypothetical protein